jgi:branched-chain amino acid transport system substrate-binding protein
MSAEAAEGHLTAAPYFESLDTPANGAFLKAYKECCGQEMYATAAAEAAYYQVQLVARALASAMSEDRNDINSALRGVQFEAPQGSVAIDPENNHCFLWPRVARLDGSKRFQVVMDLGARMKPDPYFLSAPADDRSLPGPSLKAS